MLGLGGNLTLSERRQRLQGGHVHALLPLAWRRPSHERFLGLDPCRWLDGRSAPQIAQLRLGIGQFIVCLVGSELRLLAVPSGRLLLLL